MVVAGNKAKRPSFVNHTTKTIHHHHQSILNYYLIKAPVAYSSSQKHLELILDEKLSFTNHIKVKIQISGIEINVIKSLNKILP